MTLLPFPSAEGLLDMGPAEKSTSAPWVTLSSHKNQTAVVIPLDRRFSGGQASLKIPAYAICLSPPHWSGKHYPPPDMV